MPLTFESHEACFTGLPLEVRALLEAIQAKVESLLPIELIGRIPIAQHHEYAKK